MLELISQVNSSYWLWGGAALAVLALVAVWVAVRRRGRAPDARQSIAAVAVDRLQDVLVPDGMGGHIHVEYLVLTVRGLVVIDVKNVEGVVFASDRMDDWAVIGKRGRFTIPNPQGTLYDRIAAVKQLATDVPVSGHVLFARGADFSKGRPRNVVLPGEIMELYKKPDKRDVERMLAEFTPVWDRIRAVAEPAEPL